MLVYHCLSQCWMGDVEVVEELEEVVYRWTIHREHRHARLSRWAEPSPLEANAANGKPHGKRGAEQGPAHYQPVR